MSKLRCPHCESLLQLQPEMAGKTVQCGGCDAKLKVPERINASKPEPETFRVKCPSCESELEAEPEDLGIVAPCPACQKPFKIAPGRDNKDVTVPELPTSKSVVKDTVAQPRNGNVTPIITPPKETIAALSKPTERGVAKKKAAKKKVVTESVVRKAAVEKSSAQEMSTNKAVTEDIVIKETVVKKVAVETPSVRAMSAKKAVTEDIVIKETVVKKAAVETPSVRAVSAKKTVAEDVVIKDAAVKKAADKKPSIKETTVDKVAITKKATAKKTVSPMVPLAAEKPIVQIIPGGTKQDDSAALLKNACPYPGLVRFEEKDSRVFFGRDKEVSQLVDKVVKKQQAFVAITGPSGSGKSSLVLAGLIPKIRDLGTWDVITLRPLANPLHRLAEAISGSSKNGTLAQKQEDVSNTVATLREDKMSLSRLIGDLIDKSDGCERVLVVVDQWEELYTRDIRTNAAAQGLRRYEADRDLFIDSLLEASSQNNCSVVVTYRPDFYDQIVSDPRLIEPFDQNKFNLSSPDKAQLRACIEEPAALCNCKFEEDLVDRIIADTDKFPDPLPRLAYLLSALWQLRHERELSHVGYNSVGGVGKALRMRAEDDFERVATDASEENLARRFLMGLVTPGENRAYTRTTVSIPKDGTHRKLVDVFTHSGLMAYNSEGVELSHDAVVRNWPSLEQWVDDSVQLRQIRKQLAAMEENWQADQRPADGLLSDSLSLAQAEDLLAKSTEVKLDGSLAHYLRLSLKQAKKRRRFKQVVFAAIAVVVGVVVAVIFI